MITVVVLALALAGNSSFIAAIQFNDGHIDAHQTNRSSKELQEKSRLIEDPALELKTTGRKLSSDDYNTYSSLTSDVIVETPSSSSGVSPKMYPSLTTNVPTFVTRGRYIRNPFYFTKDDQEVEFDEDQHTDLLLNGGIPKWNRYNTNHRQLNKYGPTPIEADITVDEDGSAGYGSTFEYGGGGGGGVGGYDSGGYKSTGGGGSGWSGGGGGDGMMGWFSEPIAQASRPVPIIAEIRHPSSQHKMSVDLTKIGLLALIKIAIAKLKALGFIKAMLLVLFKLKLLLLVLAVKSLMMMKLMKMAMALPALFSLLMFPMMFSRLSRLNSLLNSPVLVPTGFPDNTAGNRPGGSGSQGGGGGDEGGAEEAKRRSTLDPLDAIDPDMTFFRRLVRTEKCVERVSCRMAGARHPSLTLIWLNWAVSPVSKYIPSKKIRSFVSTFTEVTNYRLDNLYSSLLPSDWIQWCNDHYSCDRDKNKT